MRKIAQIAAGGFCLCILGLESNAEPANCTWIASYSGPGASWTQFAYLAEAQPAPTRTNISTITVNYGDTVADIVENMGYLPDGKNIEFVKIFNPEIKDINKINEGQEIFFPMVEVFQGDGWSVSPQGMRKVDGVAAAGRGAGIVAAEVIQRYEDAKSKLYKITEDEGLSSKKELEDILSNVELLASEIKDVDPQFVLGSSFIKFDNDASELAERTGVIETYIDDGISKEIFKEAISGRVQKNSTYINYQLSVYENNEPVDGYKVLSMSAGAAEIGCSRIHAKPFAKGTHKAEQYLRRARYMFWIYDNGTEKYSKPIVRDLTSIDNDEFEERYDIIWEE